MTPERHEQIANLYHLALDVAPGERSAFLERVCADDRALREEVESLLALDTRAENFIETPALLVAADLLAEESGEESSVLAAGRTVGFYRIISPLGAGGMGEVYLAEDTRLGRKIALKLLPARFTQNLDRLRWFEKEAQAASSLNHPNIITIHDIGQVEGRHFIATEFIDGQTLRHKIAQKPVKVEEAIDIAIQAVNALAAAHEAGVVHRDIKPENIMLRTDGYVKVLDFGLAKLTQPSGAQEDSDAATLATSVTATGTVMGTARYMSPEQARGQKVDERSDIFSLGVVLYEMLAGQSPFTGATTADVIAAILNEQPSLKRLVADVPEGLERIIDKALRKDRDERYSTARAMGADLMALKHQFQTERGNTRRHSSAEYLVGVLKRRRTTAAIIAAALVLIIASIVYLPVSPVSEGPIDPIDSIAVLPFVNESNDPKTEYLSDGISDTMITRLTKLPDLRVISLSAVLPYKGKSPTPHAVGNELDVRAVLIGWLKARDGLLSVSTELVDVRDNRVLWREQYNDRALSELLHVQDEISRQVVALLRLRLTGEQQKPLLKLETQSTEAYNLYLLGRFQWGKLTKEGLESSIEYFRKAIGEDPGYSLAYSGLADSFSLLGEASHVRPKEAFAQAKFNAEKALSLDKSLAEAWLSLGIVRLFFDWDWAGANEALSRAKELDPHKAHVYHFYGHYLEMIGQTSEGIIETNRGLNIEPASPYLNAELMWAYYWNRQYDAALTQALLTKKLDPGSAYLALSVAQPYEQQGKFAEALDELNSVKGPDADWAWIVAEIGYVHAKMGNRAEAEKIIQQLKSRAAREWIDPVLIGYIYIALDRKDEAFLWLDKAADEHAALIPWLKIEPKFDPIRDDPRFKRLVRIVGLSPL